VVVTNAAGSATSAGGHTDGADERTGYSHQSDQPKHFPRPDSSVHGESQRCPRTELPVAEMGARIFQARPHQPDAHQRHAGRRGRLQRPVARNLAGSVTSLVATLTVVVPPRYLPHPPTTRGSGDFTDQPGCRLVLCLCFRHGATLFQWFHDGLVIPWGTNNSLDIWPLSMAAAGGYCVVVTTLPVR